MLGVAIWMRGGEDEATDLFIRALPPPSDPRPANGALDLLEIESLKNLAWALQARDDQAAMLEARQRIIDGVVASGGIRPLSQGPDPGATARASLTFYELGLNRLVCRDPATYRREGVQGDGGVGVSEMYIDMVKRSLTYFIHGDLPHAVMPRAEWDIFYRMR
jgi:hypothetical protein